MIEKVKIIIKYVFDRLRLFCVKNKDNNLLFFGYEDSSSGAAMLSLYMVKEFANHYNVVFITPEKKDLDAAFMKYSQLILRCPNRRLYKCLYRKGFKNAILNALPTCYDAKYLKDAGINIITLIHELHFLIEEFNMQDDVLRAKAYSDVIIFPSFFGYKSFEEHYGKIECKVLIKPQGLFLTKCFESNKLDNKKYICDKHGLVFDKPIVLMVGLGDKRKGMDLFFDLCYLNINNYIQFIHIGKVLDDIKIYCLQKYGSIPSNFMNIDYVWDPSELFKYYDSASILIMLSREEPFGSVVLEAFSASTPVIGFADSGGYNEIIINDHNGYLIEYLNINELSSKINELLANKSLLKKLGTNGKKLVNKMNFDDYISFISGELV